MPKRPKFKPVVRRVKLTPEQAVLSCCDQVWRATSGDNQVGTPAQCWSNEISYLMTYTACTTGNTSGSFAVSS